MNMFNNLNQVDGTKNEYYKYLPTKTYVQDTFLHYNAGTNTMTVFPIAPNVYDIIEIVVNLRFFQRQFTIFIYFPKKLPIILNQPRC